MTHPSPEGPDGLSFALAQDEKRALAELQSQADIRALAEDMAKADMMREMQTQEYMMMEIQMELKVEAATMAGIAIAGGVYQRDSLVAVRVICRRCFGGRFFGL